MSSLNSADAVFVDANIPMYAAGDDHHYKGASQRVLDILSSGALHGVTDAEVHQEIYHRFLALRLPEKAREMSDRFRRIVPTVLPVTLRDIIRVGDLSRAYPILTARDLVHVAIMLNNGVSTIVSADRHFDQVAEIQRLDPFDATQGGSAGEAPSVRPGT